MLENLNVTNKKYHVKITIVILSFVLILTGCSRNKSDEEMAIEKLTEYFEIRYSGLTVDNFYKRYEKNCITLYGRNYALYGSRYIGIRYN